MANVKLSTLKKYDKFKITVDTLQGVRPSEDVFYKGRRGPKFVNCPWIDSPDCSVMLRPDTMVEKVTSIKVQQAD